MGVRSSLPGLRTRDPLLGPPSTLAEIFWCTCLQSRLKTSPPTPQKSNPKFQNSMTSLSRKYLKLSDTPVKIGLIGGVRGIPNFFTRLKSFYLCYLGAHAKIWKPMISLSGICWKLARFPVKMGLIKGVGGVPEICFPLES